MGVEFCPIGPSNCVELEGKGAANSKDFWGDFRTENQKQLCFGVGLRAVRVLQRFGHVGDAVFVQFLVGQQKMILGRIIFGRGQLAPQLMRTNIRRVLISNSAGIECFVGNGENVLAGFCLSLPNGEGIVSDPRS